MTARDEFPRLVWLDLSRNRQVGYAAAISGDAHLPDGVRALAQRVYRAGVFAGKPVELSADELRVLDILINAEKPRRRAA